MLVLKNEFIKNEERKALEILENGTKQRKSDARIMLQVLDVASKVLPSKIDLTTLTFGSYGVSVASLTNLMQKSLKRERFYIFAKNKTHIKENSGNVMVLVIKATMKNLYKIPAIKLYNKEISLNYINELIENGYALEVQNNLI